ncbi:MAG: TlpA family protein disulfide reductase [Fimbriimonadaceae bacterium]|nr:TlpA family protein disulfide reductase [Fimbriimonadaceae bacterium]
MFASLALALVLGVPADGVTMKFIPSGAVAKAGGYMPIRCQLTGSDAGITKKPADLVAPRYGKLTFGSSDYFIILDEAPGKPARLFVDSNMDGDLSNDAVEWKSQKRGDFDFWMASAKILLNKEMCGLSLYRFDPKDPQRATLKDTVLYYGDFGYEVTLSMDGKTMTSFIAGQPTEKMSLSVDRNGDNKISTFKERITTGTPFNFTGTTYVLRFKGGQFSLETAAEKLPIAELPPDLGIGKKALPFTTKSIDGEAVNFPSDYKGKVVMLDFWATWCGPCIAELPNVKKAYEKWHEAGFEILGISFDQENMADKVKEFTAKNGMPWRHVYEGKFWNTTQGLQYDVNGIPFVLLVDGDSGEILADSRTLRGEQIVQTIEKALAKKKSGG